MKPQRTQAKTPNESSERDRCQTPPYAVLPLLLHLPPDARIWESASGEGLLAQAMRAHGYTVYETDILDGVNFFDTRPTVDMDYQITNPPYSIKYEWLARSYAIGLPFALLMPVDVFGSGQAQELFERHGVEVILLRGRVDFKMPNKGWAGKGSQFSSAWFTHGLGIGDTLSYFDLRPHKPSRQRLTEWDAGFEQLPLFGE
jgi:hypothetical protein